MKRTLTLFLIQSFSLFFCSLYLEATLSTYFWAGQDEKITVDEVVSKYLNAIGGHEAVKNIEDLRPVEISKGSSVNEYVNVFIFHNIRYIENKKRRKQTK